MKHATLIGIVIAIVLLLGGCAAPAKDVAMEQDVNVIVEQADEADAQMEIISDIEEVEADVASAERLEGGADEGADMVVVIRDFKFQPSAMTIPAGASVEFINMDNAPHTATSDSWDTGTLAKKQSKVIVFDEPGTYKYVCQFHPGMRGQIVVE